MKLQISLSGVPTPIDKEMRRRGYTLLGDGSFGSAWLSKDKTRVMKLHSAEDVAYLKFVDFCKANPNKHLPVIYDSNFGEYENYHKMRKILMIETEVLYKISMKLQWDIFVLVCKFTGEEIGDKWKARMKKHTNSLDSLNDYKKLPASFTQTLKQVIDKTGSMHGVDLPWDNILQRENKELVIVDPWALFDYDLDDQYTSRFG